MKKVIWLEKNWLINLSEFFSEDWNESLWWSFEFQKFSYFVTIKEEHIKLLEKMYTIWDNVETWAPWCDPKRPYWNSWDSIVLKDIQEILWDWYSKEQLEKFHRETEWVLQIVLKSIWKEIVLWTYIFFAFAWLWLYDDIWFCEDTKILSAYEFKTRSSNWYHL